MDFDLSPKAQDALANLQELMDEHVYPAEPVYAAWRRVEAPICRSGEALVNGPTS